MVDISNLQAASPTVAVLTPPTQVHALEVVRSGAEQAIAWMCNALDPEELGLALRALERLTLAQDVGHTLFGSKPVTIAHIRTINDSQAHDRYPDLQEFTALRTLISKLPIGSSSLFSILRLQDGVYVGEAGSTSAECEGYHDVLFINRDRLRQVFSFHSELITQILGEGITPDSFVRQIEQRGSFLDSLKGSRLLEGLMLGYGFEASRLFEEKFSVSQKLLAERDPISLGAYRDYEIELRSKSVPLCTTAGFEGNPYAPRFMVNKFNPNADGLVPEYRRSTEWITALSEERMVTSVAIARLGGWLPAALFDSSPKR